VPTYVDERRPARTWENLGFVGRELWEGRRHTAIVAAVALRTVRAGCDRG
jgi:hypothetical protein